MNKKQIYIIIIGVAVVLINLIVWYTQGAEIFTKTRVLIDKTSELDRMLGIENKQFINKFIFGLLPSGTGSIAEILSVSSIIGLTVFLSGFLIYLFRNKRKDTK